MQKIWKYFVLLLSVLWLIGYFFSFQPVSDNTFWILPLFSIALCIIAVKKFKKFKLVIIVLSVLSAIEAFLWWYPYMAFNQIDNRLILYFGTLLIAIAVRYLSTSVKDFGKGFLVMFGLFVLGLVLKSLHMPGAGPLLVIALGSIAIMYMTQIFYSFSFVKKNILLLFIGISCSYIITQFFVGWLFKLQHWPGAGILYYIAEHYFPISFVLCSVVLLAGVQLTNFTTWAEDQRKFLVSNILIPWFIVFILGGWAFLFRDSFEKTLIRKSYSMEHPWRMEPYEIGKKQN